MLVTGWPCQSVCLCAMKYCIDIHGSQRMYSVDDTLTFRQVPPERQFSLYPMKYLYVK